MECGGIVYQMQQISVGELGSQRGSKGPLVCVWGSRDGFISQYAQKHLHINIPKEKNKQKSEKRETKFNIKSSFFSFVAEMVVIDRHFISVNVFRQKIVER